MANQTDIYKYLMEGENPYFTQGNRNGEILMISGVWGSGKTHFWKNNIEEKLIESLEKEKSYVYISLYGKDSIEELQTEIQQLSYNFSKEDRTDVVTSTYKVFTKVASFLPKFSFSAFGMGIEVEADKTIDKLENENIRLQIKKGVGRLKDGGIVCFDDFERKSSKIDLNDLFGFITNLTEIFKTKTVIITNQEFFKENDSEVFSRIKEKSVNKFLLLDPTVDELFETIYKSKTEYIDLDKYRLKILEAIKITEEKNARIFIQVLDNCLEYKNEFITEREIFLLVIITVIFVKYNLIFKMENTEIGSGFGIIKVLLPISAKEIPTIIMQNMKSVTTYYDLLIVKEDFIDKLKIRISAEYEVKDKEGQKPSDKLKDDFKYIENNQNKLFQIYKYCIGTQYFQEDKLELINRISDFVESGILVNE